MGKANLIAKDAAAPCSPPKSESLYAPSLQACPKSSRYLADIETCSVLEPQVGKQLPAISKVIASLTQYEHIPQIEVAIGDDATALVFRHLMPLPDDDVAKFIKFGRKITMNDCIMCCRIINSTWCFIP